MSKQQTIENINKHQSIWFILSIINISVSITCVAYIYISALIPTLQLIDKFDIIQYLLLYSQILIVMFGLIGIVFSLINVFKNKKPLKAVLSLSLFLLAIICIVINYTILIYI